MIKKYFPILSIPWVFLCLAFLGVAHKKSTGPLVLERPGQAEEVAPFSPGKERTGQEAISAVPMSHAESVRFALARPDLSRRGILGNQDKFSIEFSGASLDHALNLIAEMGKTNLLFKGDFSDPVDASFRDVRLDDAFRNLLESYNCTLCEKEGMQVVSRTDSAGPVSHIFALRFASAADLKENLEAILGSGSAAVAGPEGNVVMVTAPPETLEKVGRFLDSVDRPEKQVVIEARVIEVVLTDLYELGTELKFNNIHMDDTTSKFISSFLPDLPDSERATFSFAGDKAAIEGALHALKGLTRIEILSRPKILTKNDEEAKMEIIEEVPYIKSTATATVDSNGAGTSTVEEVEFKEVGLKLKVTPHIKGNNCVELKIVQDASEQMGTFLDIPVVDRRLIDTKLEVKDGDTVVIGGLIKTQDTDEVRGVPFLMDIPLLGNLFKRTRKVSEKRELIIMLTPMVVEAGEMP